MTQSNGTSVHPTEAATAELTAGDVVVELAVAGGPKDEEGRYHLLLRPKTTADDVTEPLASVPSNKLFSLAHTGVIVTGGARGLGLATAIALIESYSPHVFCLDILPNPSADEWDIAQKTAKKYGSKIEYRQLDITDENAVDQTFESIYSDCRVPIAAFFGAAGIQQRIPALEYPAKDFRRIMEVNITGKQSLNSRVSTRAYLTSLGTFLSAQAAARQMRKRGISGSICLTASMSGSIANKGQHALTTLSTCSRPPWLTSHRSYVSGLQHFESCVTANVPECCCGVGSIRHSGEREWHQILVSESVSVMV